MLKTRLLTAAILIPAFLAALFLLPEPYWSLLMLAGALIGLWEWSYMARFKVAVRYLYIAATVVAGVFLTFWHGPENAFMQEYALYWGLPIAAAFWIILVPVWLLTRAHIRSPYLLMLAGWLIIFPLWLALVSLRAINPWLLLAIMLVVWIADSAAYFAGKRFGKHKLAVHISPGKTWEGVAGALIVVSLYGLALCFAFNLNLLLIVGFWVLTVFSIVGDLLESLIKRQAGVKDSGNLLPGHGGVLDRVDGLTSSLPLAALFLHLPLYYQAWMHSA
ncbi:phosphatidate cytidylyltransferase [Methylobacillus arboreus]|uniref:phosphatidate cytidylyltransferase n=1 Tax=Methylobacillus arboreus TaxID=755170 RepID=UPI001E4F681B|nr:phosphatidate cytidylyltransferase [Methylobacillus arboreus]MCB5189887.1 phosphatidate cytidylyltransferase [Methylobacillus arboreus]